MRFDLEADVDSSSNRTIPGVVLEDAHHQSRSGRWSPEDGFLEQVVERLALEFHHALERLVGAVLAPGLGDGFELAVRRLPAVFAKWS